MHISKIAISRPVATAMFFLAVVLLGIISLFRLRVALLPDLSYPKLTVWTAAPEIGPREIEELVTSPVEEAVSTVAGIRRTYSLSREGISLVTVEFLWGTQMDFATLNVREKLDQLRWILPQEAGRPSILTMDPSAQPIMALSLSGSELLDLKSLAENVYKRRLEQIKGVAMATVIGGPEREIHVEIDRDKLQLLNISLDQVVSALKQANYSLTGGTIKKGIYRYALRTLGEFQQVAEIENVVIANRKDGAQIRVRDVAVVDDGFRERQSITRFNGKESIGLVIRKEAGSNTVSVAAEIKKVLAELKESYPQIKVTVAYNNARFISSAIKTVVQNLIFGALLAFLVLFVFLHDLRNPINIALSIPISVIATFALLFFSDISLNIMSLGGLALGVGMLVDNAIIVLENIFRHREEGKSQEDSAFLGAHEVAMPITASTLTTIAIFLPVVYIYGVAGQLFRDQAITVAFSLIASLVVALTLLPMLSCRFYFKLKENVELAKPEPLARSQKKPWCWLANPILWIADQIRYFSFIIKKNVTSGMRQLWQSLSEFTRNFSAPFFKFFDETLGKLFSLYHRFLISSLNKRKLFLAIVIFILLLGIMAAFHQNRSLMPRVDEGEFTAKLELPVGSTLEATAREAANLENWLLQQPRVEAVFTTIGISQDQSAMITEEAALNRAVLKIRLAAHRDISTAEMIARMRENFSGKIVGEITFDRGEQALQQILGTTTPPIVIKVRGSELNVCCEIADSLLRVISSVDGLKDLHSDYLEGQPEYRIEIDRERAANYGMSTAEVAAAIRGFLAGEQATQFVEFDRKIPIIVRPRFSQRDDLNDLLNLTFTNGNRVVPIRDLIKVITATGPSIIRHEDQTRQISLLANLQGRSLNSVTKELQQKIAHFPLPQNYQILMGGEQEEVYRSFRSLLFAMALAVLLIYMILSAQFESLRHPFVILLDVPLTISLVLILLWISGIGLNVISFIGLIVLAGIAVNDSIVKVDFINQRRREGMKMCDAILDAGKKRFRPILMTSVTTILGLLPMAIGFGEGAELQRPLALTIITGLLISTVVSLVAVPVFYTFFSKK